MRPAVAIRVISYVRASDADQRTGLVGYLSVAVGELVVDGITLRLTAAGRHALSFPSRVDRRGERRAIVRPVDDAARRSIERELLEQLQEQSRDVATFRHCDEPGDATAVP